MRQAGSTGRIFPNLLDRVASSVAKSRPFAWLVGLLERLDREEPDLLRVLTYHRVEWSDAMPPPYPRVTISPDAFAEQMRYIREHYRIVSVEELIRALQSRGSLPPRSILVTFDDGYQDFRSRAWPVLRELKLPVALFVPTAFPGEPTRLFWWDRLHHALTNTTRRDDLETPVGRLPLGTARDREDAYTLLRAHAKQLPHAEALPWVDATCVELAVPPPPPAVLSWDELRGLAREGVTVGSHTRTHPLLTRIPMEEVRAEVAGSLRDLERELGHVLPIFAYPGGAFNDGVVRTLADVGCVLAFTTVRGVNDLKTAHPLKLRRIHVGRRTSLPLLRAQLTARSVGLNRFFPLTSAVT
jgi:peptidoglycan/xylan/chitin deacetylase (PgdA/CDA1 family)